MITKLLRVISYIIRIASGPIVCSLEIQLRNERIRFVINYNTFRYIVRRRCDVAGAQNPIPAAYGPAVARRPAETIRYVIIINLSNIFLIMRFMRPTDRSFASNNVYLLLLLFLHVKEEEETHGVPRATVARR